MSRYMNKLFGSEKLGRLGFAIRIIPLLFLIYGSFCVCAMLIINHKFMLSVMLFGIMIILFSLYFSMLQRRLNDLGMSRKLYMNILILTAFIIPIINASFILYLILKPDKIND